MLVVVELLASICELLWVSLDVLHLGRQSVERLGAGLLGDAFPHGVDHVAIVQSLEDAVAANHEEVEVVLDLERLDLRIAHNHVGVSAVPRLLGLDVSESAGHRKTAWKAAQRPLNIQVLFVWRLCGFGKSLCSIDLSSSCLNSDFLLFVVRLVVSRAHSNLRPRIQRHNAPTVSNVDHVSHVVNDYHDCRTRAGTLRSNVLLGHLYLGALLGHLNQVDEVSLTLLEACEDGLLRVGGELLILYHKVVEVIAQVVGTSSTAMTVKDPEKADLWPLSCELLVLGLEDVQDNGHTVFVVFTNDALVGVCSV